MGLELPDLEPYLNKIREKSLKLTLKSGIGFLYQGMSEEEQRIIIKMFEAQAIKVIICSYKMCWELEIRSYFVAILGVQRYDGVENRFIDYTIPDML